MVLATVSVYVNEDPPRAASAHKLMTTGGHRRATTDQRPVSDDRKGILAKRNQWKSRQDFPFVSCRRAHRDQ